MKALAVLGIVLSTAVAFGQTGSGGFGANSSYNRLWTNSRQITIDGKVAGKIVAPPVRGMANGVALTLKHPDKPAIEVQLGPEWYITQLPIEIEVGDEIMVSGSQVTLDGRSVIMAETVSLKNSELILRERNGVPRWIGFTATAQPTNFTEDGTLTGQGTVMINGVEYQTFEVDTGSGTVNIVGAPTWFANRQDYTVNVGNGVQIVGAMQPVQIGPNLFWADSLYTNGALIVLRPW